LLSIELVGRSACLEKKFAAVEGRKEEVKQRKYLLIRAISGCKSIDRKPNSCLKKQDGGE